MSTDETPHEYRIRLEENELELVHSLNPSKILEVFSGDGTNLIAFSYKGYSVEGIEENEQLYERSLQKIGSRKKIKITKHEIFGNTLPYEDGSFDFIYTYQYINHNYKKEIEEVFREIFRMLKIGGIFSIKISDMDQFNLQHVKGDIYKEMDPEFPQIHYKKLAQQTYEKMEGDEKGIPHYAFFKDELIESLSRIGFTLIDCRVIRWNIVANFRKDARETHNI